MTTAAAPAIGHNQGPELSVTERLTSDYEGFSTKLEAIASEANALPKVIDSDAAVEPFVEVVRKAKALGKLAEDSRKVEKEPHLQAGRDVDAFFKTMTDRLTRMSTSLEARVGEWQREKARREREAREEAERIAREEAERRMREAEEAELAKAPTVQQVEALTSAVEADQRLQFAEQRASATVTDMGRVRTAAGVASISSVWRFEVQDAAKIPLDQLRQFIPRPALEQALGAFVRMGGRELPGVRIYEDTKTVIR